MFQSIERESLHRVSNQCRYFDRYFSIPLKDALYDKTKNRIDVTILHLFFFFFFLFSSFSAAVDGISGMSDADTAVRR